MHNIPYEKMAIDWIDPNPANEEGFVLNLPWFSIEIEVTPEDKGWIKDAVAHLHREPLNGNVQRFMKELQEPVCHVPICYIKPRSLEEFSGTDFKTCPDIAVDTSTPSRLVETLGCPIDNSLKEDILPNWTWDWEEILSKGRIEGTDLYDPLSIVSYLICYRLDWESKTWSGQGSFYKFLESTVKEDEEKFFRKIGWVVKQSWYVTSGTYDAMKTALPHFGELLEHFIDDEIGHYKFMEQVFEDLELNKDDFPVGAGTKWVVACHKLTGVISPLAYSAMINIFEAAYYEGKDPISRVLELSSRPYASRGYDMHYKINQEHRHCDMPLNLAACLAPQTRDHVLLTLGIFEQALTFLDRAEEKLAKEGE